MTDPTYHSPKVRSGFFAFNVIALLVAILTLLPQDANALEVKDGQSIVLLGNTLAERMQHHGWLETYAQLSMPDKKLSFRNHGFCGDKIDNRPRNRGFIDPHTYLEISKADVILTFFGAKFLF